MASPLCKDTLKKLKGDYKHLEQKMLESVRDKLDDHPMFYIIGTFWDCPKSPFGLCAYHEVSDRAHDDCVFCHDPAERK